MMEDKFMWGLGRTWTLIYLMCIGSTVAMFMGKIQYQEWWMAVGSFLGGGVVKSSVQKVAQAKASNGDTGSGQRDTNPAK